MADATTTDKPTPPAPATPAGAPATGEDDGKGGKAAVLADLATERKERQALEAQVQLLTANSEAQKTALAKAFGLTPDETSDVSKLAEQVTALKDQFTQTQRQNVVLAAANEHGISDPEDLQLLADAKDEDAIKRLAARIAKANEGTSPTKPKPDLSQGRNSGPAPKTPGEEFATFLTGQLG